VVTCPASKVVEASSAAGATATYSAATAVDVASTTTTITYSQLSNTVFPLGATTVTATAKDPSNNTATCTFTITVRDTTAPTVTCPLPITIEATSASGATVTYSPATVSDAVTATPAVTYSVASGSTFPLGTTAVQVVARDEADNTRSCAFNVVVRDTTAPAITCPADVTVEATSSAGAVATYDAATATDAVSTPTVSYSKASDSLFPLGKTTVTATAKDSSDNTVTCTFSVTVRDTTPPTVVCPADVTAEATSAAGGPATYAAASATDLVSTAAVTYSKASGTSFPMGSTTVTVIAKDAANNEATCTFSVTVRDSTAPAITCPANVTVEATSETGATATYTAATATDAVTASPTLSYSKVSGSVFALGTTTVTATAKDETNNESTCSFTVLVRDTTAPEIACPADVIAEATSAAGAQVTYADATATDVVSAPQVSYSQASRSVFPLGETVVTASAKDAANNSSSCTFKVTVRDTTPPAFTCPVDYSVEATEAVGAWVTYPAIIITDLVTAAPVTEVSPATGSRLELGKTTVTVTSIDAANNVASCSFVVSVVDTTPPDVECPNKVTVEARSATGAVVNYRDAAAADIVTSIPTLGYSTPSGSEFPVGITIVDVTATDAASNTAHCTFEVEVRDTTAPQVTCPENLTAEATSSAGATLSFESATAQDAVTAAPAITYSPEKNSTFPLGTTMVTASARDGSNNTATCTFTITVRDTTPPALVCPPDVIAEASSAAGGLAIYPDAAATDFVSASPTVTYSRESNSDFPMGASVVTVSAQDGAGNTSSCQFSVTVKDTTPPAVTCPVDVLAEATSGAGAAVSFGAPVANDPVSTPVVTLSKESNTVFALGTTKVTATARDAANNTATCTFNVIVADTTPPELLCPESVVAEATSSEGALVTYTEPAATDLVGTPTVTISSPSMSAFPLGDTEVEATASDAAGNRATCTFTVSVLDTTAPLIVPPATVLVEATSADGALVDYPTVTATDLVSTATLAFTPPSGTLLPLGFTTVTVRATDAAGNASQSSFEVNVRDTTPPSVTCPARMEVVATSDAGATVGYGLPNVSDAVTARPTIHLDPESGSLFPVGETKVTATATDTAGNSGTCQFTVSVTPMESAGPATVKASGCGCSSGDASMGVLLLAAAVAGLRRRRTAPGAARGYSPGSDIRCH
jgi:MYXO-CTERM domain-containing protein